MNWLRVSPSKPETIHKIACELPGVLNSTHSRRYPASTGPDRTENPTIITLLQETEARTANRASKTVTKYIPSTRETDSNAIPYPRQYRP